SQRGEASALASSSSALPPNSWVYLASTSAGRVSFLGSMVRVSHADEADPPCPASSAWLAPPWRPLLSGALAARGGNAERRKGRTICLRHNNKGNGFSTCSHPPRRSRPPKGQR